MLNYGLRKSAYFSFRFPEKHPKIPPHKFSL